MSRKKQYPLPKQSASTLAPHGGRFVKQSDGGVLAVVDTVESTDSAATHDESKE